MCHTLQNNLARKDSNNAKRVINRFTAFEDTLQRHDPQVASFSSEFDQMAAQQDDTFKVMANHIRYLTSLLKEIAVAIPLPSRAPDPQPPVAQPLQELRGGVPESYAREPECCRTYANCSVSFTLQPTLFRRRLLKLPSRLTTWLAGFAYGGHGVEEADGSLLKLSIFLGGVKQGVWRGDWGVSATAAASTANKLSPDAP